MELFRRVWYATGCMCTKYLKAIIVQAIANLAELEHVDPSASAEVAAMSASTMDRVIKGLERKGPGSMRKNRRSGKNDPATYFTCCSGEKTIAAETEPGHIQVDTVALCGGNMHGNFFWILTLTDRKTQWTEIYPVWNKGAAEVLNAMKILMKRFPFKILSLHYDNGKEFMNSHLVTFVRAIRKSASSGHGRITRTTMRMSSRRTDQSSEASLARSVSTVSSIATRWSVPVRNGLSISTSADPAS